MTTGCCQQLQRPGQVRFIFSQNGSSPTLNRRRNITAVENTVQDLTTCDNPVTTNWPRFEVVDGAVT